MGRQKLTKTRIDRLAPDPNRDVRYYDDELRGFGVKVFRSGRKTFFIEYWHRKRRRRMSIGSFGQLSLDQARRMARKHFARVADGIDPLAERQAEAEIPTFGEWAERYLSRIRLQKKRPELDEMYLKRVPAHWNRLALDQITARHVEDAMAKEAERGYTTANRWLASVRACLQAAWKSRLISDNPAARVDKFRENPPRNRVLTDDELKRFIKALEEEPDPHTKAAFHLLLETGARLSEVLRAKWEDFDLRDALWRIPSPKAGIPQIVPLANRTIAMLQSLTRRGDYVIAGRFGNRPRYDLKSSWNRLCERASLSGVTIHDIRRTFGLHAARTAGLHVASKLLRHSDIRITERVYAPLGIDDLRNAMEQVQQPADVIAFERASPE
jgi:integrase